MFFRIKNTSHILYEALVQKNFMTFLVLTVGVALHSYVHAKYILHTKDRFDFAENNTECRSCIKRLIVVHEIYSGC